MAKKRRKVRMQDGPINSKAHCLACNYGPMDCAIGMEFSDAEEPLRSTPIRPKHGSISICVKCGNIAIYQNSSGGLTLRPATQDEIAFVATTPELNFIWQRYKKKPHETN